MNEQKPENVSWRMFKESVVSFAMFLGIAWVMFSSVLMVITVLRAIVH